MQYYGVEIPETACQYDGRYFDSKTEALWASYFDEMGLEWYREPDTFELRAITHGQNWYTPDFYIPHWDSYVEVKNGNLDYQSGEKIRHLARSIGNAVILLNGRPGDAFNVHLYSPDGDLGGAQNTFVDSGEYIFTHTQLLRSATEYMRTIQSARLKTRGAALRSPPNPLLAYTSKKEKEELQASRLILSD